MTQALYQVIIKRYQKTSQNFLAQKNNYESVSLTFKLEQFSQKLFLKSIKKLSILKWFLEIVNKKIKKENML